MNKRFVGLFFVVLLVVVIFGSSQLMIRPNGLGCYNQAAYCVVLPEVVNEPLNVSLKNGDTGNHQYFRLYINGAQVYYNDISQWSPSQTVRVNDVWHPSTCSAYTYLIEDLHYGFDGDVVVYSGSITPTGCVPSPQQLNLFGNPSSKIISKTEGGEQFGFSISDLINKIISNLKKILGGA